MIRLISLFDQCLEKIALWGMVVCFLSVLFLSVISIVLRWMGETVLWIDPLCRHLILLLTFLGASLATGHKDHIKIDFFHLMFRDTGKKKWKKVLRMIVLLFCLLVTFFLTYSSWSFFQMEVSYGTRSFLGLHSSLLVFILPMGFALIHVRFLNRFIIEIFLTGEKCLP